MKRIYTLLITTLFMLAVLPMVSCERGQTGAPQNFEIAANSTGDKVVLSWDEPSEGVPDEYVIYFDEGGTGTFDTVATTTDLEYTHDPQGKTGKYKVAARLGDNEYDSPVLSTIPIHTASMELAELNAAGNSGYGWDRTSFSGTTYSMTQSANAPSVDFYLSNWYAGYQQLPYGIWAPDQGPSDPGGVVPTGNWKATAIGKFLLTNENAILPEHTTTNYVQYVDMTSFPALVAIYTTDGYYALVKVPAEPSTDGKVNVETWFQSVKGLRLIAH